MHISEGVLSAPVLLAGAAVAVAGIARGLRKLDEEKLVTAGLMGAVFFVGSLVHVPIGFSSAHLILNGLVGVLLGWAAFPAIFVALALQAALFQYGGLTTLGLNTATMGAGAVAAWYVFRFFMAKIPNANGWRIGSLFAGFLGVAISSLLTACALAFTAEGFRAAAAGLFLAHLPVMIAEGLITMLTVGFIARVRPQMLGIQLYGEAAPMPMERKSA